LGNCTFRLSIVIDYMVFLDQLHLLENTFERKRTSANPSPNSNPSPNTNRNLEAQLYFRIDEMTSFLEKGFRYHYFLMFFNRRVFNAIIFRSTKIKKHFHASFLLVRQISTLE